MELSREMCPCFLLTPIIGFTSLKLRHFILLTFVEEMENFHYTLGVNHLKDPQDREKQADARSDVIIQ